MDNRLVLTVLFVVLSWASMGTYAQMTNTTQSPMTVNMTMNGTGSNMTTPMPGNMTTPVPGNMTTPVGGNMTTPMASNMTTPMAGNMTTPVASNMTTPVTTPMAPTLPGEQPVVDLPTNISREQCGNQQLCASEPADCNPSTGSCFFLGVQQNNSTFLFNLAGESDGYIAASLSAPGQTGGATTYICARSSMGSAVRFFAARLNNNNQLTLANLPASSVRGRANGRIIQCTFAASPAAVVRASQFALAIATGPIDTSGTLGAPVLQLRTAPLDLANPNATVIRLPAILPLTAAALTTPISNQGCGSTKLCADEPDGCNPSSSGACTFFSARQQSGQTFNFELSGPTNGYVAAALAPSSNALPTSVTAFVCANNNNSVAFLSGLLNLTQISLVQPVNITSVNGSVNNNEIQCTFTASVPESPAATRAALFSIIVVTGNFNSTTLGVESSNLQIRTNVVNLTDPTANVTNLLTANSSSTAIAFHQPVALTLLFTAGVLGLTML
ncbi:putative ferric-chelate reductase 1 isoform X2 [Mugil cephalus]|uniref:putative ferric-chelate reductase 1 isoform X2 n=1 Tax=Mugil cephalus TaxID=48193 RepID=UPI001FB72918|nr:putative ferric-chelate reductase 1 isoform X2 [Mugil cephalus]